MGETHETNPTLSDPAKTPFAEMHRLAELYPQYTLLQVIEMLDRKVWDIEVPTEAQRTIYCRINAQSAIEQLRKSFDKLQSEFSLDTTRRTVQWLETGSHVHIPNIIDDKVIKRLESHCDDLLQVMGTQPIRLFEHLEIIDQETLISIANAAISALPTPMLGSSKPAILKKRTLLRRTFPLKKMKAQVGNANNQFWHQDSNAMFNDSRMLTLWIPLQNMSGVTRPGLQIMDASVSYFSVHHGDSSEYFYPHLKTLFPDTKIHSPVVEAGDCIMINGLTFHQTSTHDHMTNHRDALLVRVIDADSAHLFHIDDPAKDLVHLG